eukprot:UN01872
MFKFIVCTEAQSKRKRDDDIVYIINKFKFKRLEMKKNIKGRCVGIVCIVSEKKVLLGKRDFFVGKQQEDSSTKKN